MQLTITQKADTIGTLRFVFVRLMEMLAGWVPTSPELEIKVLFGRHIWVLAQHADMLGQRTLELRAKLHYERPPVTAYAEALEHARQLVTSRERVGACYDVLLPDLSRRITAYLADADALLDAPTVDILHRVLDDFTRIQRDVAAVTAERPDVLTGGELASTAGLQVLLDRCGPFVDYRTRVTA